jgi:hypothetical protein
MGDEHRKAGRRPRASRRGPRLFNDAARLDELSRLSVNDPSKTIWQHAKDLVQRDGRAGKSSEKADVHRLNRKYKRLKYDPARAANAPLLAEELKQEGFMQESQFLVDQDSKDWLDMGPKGYFPIKQMPDGRWKVQRHLRGLLTYDELCVQCAPYFTSIAHLLDQNAIEGAMQADKSDEGIL